MAKKKGRPVGSKTEENPVVIVDGSRCPKCQSTNRTVYMHTRRMDFSGIHNGLPYTSIVWRHCQCEDCGQKRVDKSYE